MAVDPTTGDLVVVRRGRSLASTRHDGRAAVVLRRLDLQRGGPLGTAVDRRRPQRRRLRRRPAAPEHFAADGSWKGTLQLPTNLFPATGIAVDPQNGDVAVELPSGVGLGPDPTIRIYTAANTLKDVIRVPPTLVQTDGNGQINNVALAFAPDGSKLYVGLKDGSAHVYSRGRQPGVDAPAISNLTPTSARVSADVATGGDSTLARIEYCLASDPCDENLGSDGSSPWHRLPDHTGLTGGADPANPGQDTIADDLTGLLPNERYLLRTYAINTSARWRTAPPRRMLTTAVPPPLVTTGTVDGVTDTSAELSGSVDNTFGDQTTYHFEYGITTNYGSRLPAGADGVAGNLRTPRAVHPGRARAPARNDLPLPAGGHQLRRHRLRRRPDVHDAGRRPGGAPPRLRAGHRPGQEGPGPVGQLGLPGRVRTARRSSTRGTSASSDASSQVVVSRVRATASVGLDRPAAARPAVRHRPGPSSTRSPSGCPTTSTTRWW